VHSSIKLFAFKISPAFIFFLSLYIGAEGRVFNYIYSVQLNPARHILCMHIAFIRHSLNEFDSFTKWLSVHMSFYDVGHDLVAQCLTALGGWHNKVSIRK